MPPGKQVSSVLLSEKFIHDINKLSPADVRETEITHKVLPAIRDFVNDIHVEGKKFPIESLPLDGERYPVDADRAVRKQGGKWKPVKGTRVMGRDGMQISLDVKMLLRNRYAFERAFGLSDGALGAIINRAFGELAGEKIDAKDIVQNLHQRNLDSLRLVIVHSKDSQHLFEVDLENGIIFINADLLKFLKIIHTKPRLY